MNKVRAAVDTLTELAVLYGVLLCGCAGIFALVEGRSFIDALYWAGTTATSTGYGDISPQTIAGKVLAFLLMHVAIFFVAPLVIVRMHQRLVDNPHEFTDAEQREILAILRELKDRP